MSTPEHPPTTGAGQPAKGGNTVLDSLRTIITVVLVVTVVRTFLFESFVIDPCCGASAIGTIQAGGKFSVWPSAKTTVCFTGVFPNISVRVSRPMVGYACRPLPDGSFTTTSRATGIMRMPGNVADCVQVMGYDRSSRKVVRVTALRPYVFAQLHAV